nr:hypothetical protein [Mucilaginibacter sp. E4BP6]
MQKILRCAQNDNFVYRNISALGMERIPAFEPNARAV